MSAGVDFHLGYSPERIDRERKAVVGRLVAGGVDTGVQVEIRAGGPAIGFQEVTSLLRTDRSITLGMVPLDEMVLQSVRAPTLGVVAPMAIDPQVLMWDPDLHPGWNTIQDIGQTNVKVFYSSGASYMDYLVGSGILRQSQVDGSYQGSPDVYFATGRRVVVQGYLTNEPYSWLAEVPQGRGHRIQTALIYDTGYPNYTNILAIDPARRAELDRCLRRLVPIIQRAQVGFLAHPDPALKIIVAAGAAYKAFPYSLGDARYSARTQRDAGIVANGPDGTLGDFDQKRVERIINIQVPILTGRKQPVRGNLAWTDLVTNDYVQRGLGLPTRWPT